METKRFIFLIAGLMCLFASANAQSTAALEKLQQRLDSEQITEMQRLTNYKYEGMLLFYSSSFLVVDNGQPRAATEAEIRAVDIDQYNALRTETAAVSVHDATLGKDLLLLGRDEFEQVVLGHLSDADAAAYLAYKAQSLSTQGKTAH